MPLALRSRRPTDAHSSAPPPIGETDLDRILKLIPGELLAFYTAAVPITAEIRSRYFPCTLFIAGVVLVPLILYLDGRATHQAASWPQYVARTLCFMAWANAILWPFAPWVSKPDLNWLRSLGVLIVPLVGALVLRDRPPVAPPD